MDAKTNVNVEMKLVGWATPKPKWFNLIPNRFMNKKATQIQKLINQLEKDGAIIQETMSTPFTYAIKVTETRVV